MDWECFLWQDKLTRDFDFYIDEYHYYRQSSRLRAKTRTSQK